MSVVQVGGQPLTLRIIATFRAVGGDEDALDRAGKAVVITQEQFAHQRSVGVVLNRGSQRDAGVHGDVPNRAAEAEAVDQVQGNGHVDRIDGQNLIMNLGIVDVAVGEVDLAGIKVVRDHRSVVDNALGVCEADVRAIIRITDLAGHGGLGRKFRSLRSGYDVANRREVDGAFIEHDVSVRIQVTGPRCRVDKVELRGKVQTEFLGNPLIGNVSQDVPGRLAGALH